MPLDGSQICGRMAQNSHAYGALGRFRPRLQNHGRQLHGNGLVGVQETVDILDNIKFGTEAPRRVFEAEERKSLGKKLIEHMDYVYNNMGSIERGVLDPGKETVKIEKEVSAAERRACKRFDLVGKAPNEFLHDTLKQVYNSKKWAKTFAPILAGTFGLTLLAQFFFGKKDHDIKA